MKTYLRSICCAVAIILTTALASPAASKLVQEEITFESSLDKTGPLLATVIYPDKAAGKLPIMIVQHGYGGSRQNVYFSANRFAESGFFCVCIDTRGWGGSAGKHDDGGLEIMDIFDGCQFVSRRYRSKIDTNKVSIVGYSNGGANVFFASTRFPYLFNASMALFGIPDYKMWIESNATFKDQVIGSVGGTPETVPDKYAARNAIQAAGNLLSGTRFHIAYDEGENLCPFAMDEAFVASANKANVKNIFVHVSKAGDKARWGHGYNTGNLNAIEDVFIEDIKKSKAETPIMPANGELTVIGFIVTPKFRCILGKGDDAVALMKFKTSASSVACELKAVTSDKKAPVSIILDKNALAGKVDVYVNGKKAKTPADPDKVEASGTISDTIEFRAIK